MKVTWLGTAGIRIEAMGERFVFDPFVELPGAQNPNILGDFQKDPIIFLTHGHFDHAYFVPDLIEQGDVTVFCTKTPAQTLEHYLDNADSIVQIGPGDALDFGKCRINVYRGKHIHKDFKIILHTLLSPRIFHFFRNFRFIIYAYRRFPEAGETVCFELSAEGKRVLILGSLGLDPDCFYPDSPDLLILPYQGSSREDLLAQAGRVIDRIRPRRIMLSHFDDAFPPISRNIDTRSLRRMMKERFPDISVIKPLPGTVHII